MVSGQCVRLGEYSGLTYPSIDCSSYQDVELPPLERNLAPRPSLCPFLLGGARSRGVRLPALGLLYPASHMVIQPHAPHQGTLHPFSDPSRGGSS